MAIEFKLPEVSEGVTSADVAEIHVAEGDVIEAGQIVLEVETEKAVADIPCPHAGRVAKIHVARGDSVLVGAPLLTIEPAEAGAKAPAAAPKPAEPAKTAPDPAPAAVAEPPKTAPAPQPAPPAARSEPASQPAAAAATTTALSAPRTMGPGGGDNGSDHRTPAPAGPSTRRLARELGVDLHRVSGSGPGGRITPEDVQAYVRTLTTGSTSDVANLMAAPQLPDFNRFGPIERRPLSKLVRTAAANLTLSWQVVPHVTQHELCDVTDLEEARQNYMRTVGQNGPKITMTAIMVKAVVGALKAFPHFNSTLDGGASELILKQYYHIGVAVDTEYGLLVPVVRDADRKSVLTIAREISDISARARDRKLELAEMQGATFTITNLGGIGGTAFTPIVNYPEVAILGMSRTRKQWDFVDGKPVQRLMLPLSLSYDHRVINGADAARFIVKLSRILSDFFQLLIEC